MTVTAVAELLYGHIRGTHLANFTITAGKRNRRGRSATSPRRRHHRHRPRQHRRRHAHRRSRLPRTISVTSANGGILFNNAATPNVSASSTTLTEAAQPVSSAQSVALAQLHATEVIAAADAASAQAFAAADAAGAGSRGTGLGQFPPGCVDFHPGRGDDR